MSTEEIEQRTPEWFAARLGKATSSRNADIQDRTAKGTEGAKRRNYRIQLALERITGKSEPVFETYAMKQGTEREPVAKRLYEYRTNTQVIECGFVNHPRIPMCGGSTDGFIGEVGITEFKCPLPSKHLENLQAIAKGELPSDYKPQVLGHLSNNPTRKWCDFSSFNPDFPANAEMGTVRVYRAQYAASIAELESDIEAFLFEVSALEEWVRDLNGGIEALPKKLRDVLPESSEWDHCIAQMARQYPDAVIGDMFDQAHAWNYDKSTIKADADGHAYHAFRRGEEVAVVLASAEWTEWALSGDTTPFI